LPFPQLKGLGSYATGGRGGEVIHGFAFALIAGILIGTYSSIYIASPVMLSLAGRFQGDEDAVKAMEARP